MMFESAKVKNIWLHDSFLFQVSRFRFQVGANNHSPLTCCHSSNNINLYKSMAFKLLTLVIKVLIGARIRRSNRNTQEP